MKRYSWILWLAAGLLVGVGMGVAYQVYIGLQPAAASGDEQVFQVKKGSSLRQVADDLQKAGLVRSARVMLLAARFQKKGNRLYAGNYLLSPAMSPMDILEKIIAGDVATVRVTIPEGFTVRQIAETLADKGLVDKARFIALCTKPTLRWKLRLPIPKVGLEGYLFPDTYDIPVGATEEQIIDRMLARFEELMPKWYRKDMPLGLHETVTLASMVEREARRPQERARIAGVYINRLKHKPPMKLQCDATVLYAIGGHKSRVLYRDLEVDSPYNTYKYPGLPPGPIANPGLACLKAAANPEKHDFLYYVARADGSHIFSRTMKEHLQSVAVTKATRRAAR